MAHLGQSPSITTVQDKEIVLTASDGQTFKMKVSDLAEAVRQVMPVATSDKNGLMSRHYYTHRFNYQVAPKFYELFKLPISTDDHGVIFEITETGDAAGTPSIRRYIIGANSEGIIRKTKNVVLYGPHESNLYVDNNGIIYLATNQYLRRSYIKLLCFNEVFELYFRSINQIPSDAVKMVFEQ